MIISNLQDYGVPVDRVFGITSDNGENMLKAIATVDSIYQQQKETHQTLSEESDGSSDDSIDNDILDSNFYSTLLNDVRSRFNQASYSDLISGVSCACHGLHLIITKAISKSATKTSLIDKCRELSKKLRTQTFRYVLEKENIKCPVIDVITRWNSTFAMVNFFESSNKYEVNHQNKINFIYSLLDLWNYDHF